MAFCNSCGASITPGTRFCNKCGAAVIIDSPPATGVAPSAAGGAATSQPPIAASRPAQGGSALKVILIAVGAVVLLGILGITALVFFATRVARHSRIHQDGNNVKVETPFGTVETTKDPDEAARNLGVDLYPGADLQKDGAASATFGGVHTVSLSSESGDSVDKVASFYKSKFPNAMVTSSDAGRCTIISNDHKSMITINIEAERGKTKIQITNVTRKSDAGNSSSN
jgi:hypothetical protein